MKTTRSRNRLPIVVAAAMLAAVLGVSAPYEELSLDAWAGFSKKKESSRLMRWLREQARERLTGAELAAYPSIEVPPFFGSLGIFITLKKGNRLRGCYGAFSHATTDIGILLSDYLAGALARDPRYAPLDVAELAETEIILTVTTQPIPVNSPEEVDPHRYGITVACEGTETAVFVPAEIRSISYLEKFIRGKACQVSAFRAVTIR